MAPVETVRPRLTFADLERMPDDGRRYELYDGEVVVVPAPLPIHQIIQHRLNEILTACARQQGGISVDSPVDVLFTDRDVLQPDIVYFARERRHLIDVRRVIRHAPDLCVEVVSPSTAKRDRGAKMQTFARFGVKEYWIVETEPAAIEVYELDGDCYQLRLRAGGSDVLTSPMLPGLNVMLEQVFQDLA
jgi:Uma2 family endonuclease